MGVGYAAAGAELTPMLLPYNNASESTRSHLHKVARLAASHPREPAGYDVCQEGAFFHAGLQPMGGVRDSVAPQCTAGTWALQDDIGEWNHVGPRPMLS